MAMARLFLSSPRCSQQRQPAIALVSYFVSTQSSQAIAKCAHSTSSIRFMLWNIHTNTKTLMSARIRLQHSLTAGDGYLLPLRLHLHHGHR